MFVRPETMWLFKKIWLSLTDVHHLKVSCLGKVTCSGGKVPSKIDTSVELSQKSGQLFFFRCLNFSWLEWHVSQPGISWWTLRIKDCSWNFAVKFTFECAVLYKADVALSPHFLKTGRVSNLRVNRVFDGYYICSFIQVRQMHWCSLCAFARLHAIGNACA